MQKKEDCLRVLPGGKYGDSRSRFKNAKDFGTVIPFETKFVNTGGRQFTVLNGGIQTIKLKH